MSNDITEFYVSSGFGHRAQEPCVQIVIERADFMTQMPPEKARELAHNLLACADAAESDAFLITFLRERVGADDSAVVAILSDFREWREKRQVGGDAV